MKISDASATQASPEWRKSLDYAVASMDFQRRLVDAGNSLATPATESSTVAAAPAETPKVAAAAEAPASVRDAQYTFNGAQVSFDELPLETQHWFEETDRKRTECESYRARVADDPNIGAYAKLRPYDEALDGWAMKRLAAMDPSTAHMTPQEYYNYAGSDREKYGNLIQAAQAPARGPAKPVFDVDPEQESKVQFVRELWSQGREVPKTYADLEKLWRSDFAQRQAAADAADPLLSTGSEPKS